MSVDPQIVALRTLMTMQERMLDKFLQELVSHLNESVQSFDGQMFLERLYLAQESLPTPDKSDPRSPKSLEEIGLEAWRRKVDAVERALKGAGASR